MKKENKYYCDFCKKEIKTKKTGFLNNLPFGKGMKPDRDIHIYHFNINSLVGLFAYKKIFFFRTRFDECYQELCDDCVKELNNTINKLYKK